MAILREEDYRLPYSVVPFRYELALEPDLSAARFAGDVKIDVEVGEPVTEIVLNAAELEITNAGVLPKGGRRLRPEIVLDEESERLVLRMEDPLAEGSYTLDIQFTGTLNDKLAGFYRSTFADAEGVERVIATTQFESTDARRAFPCWDEPDRKAVFSIRITADHGLTIISNGPVIAERSEAGKRSVVFGETIPMSTYLVAFVVGPLDVTPPVDVDGTPLRVVHVPGKQHLTAFALESGGAAFRFFTDYFGIPYPAEKLDLIALPDFASGAMENLGAITFRETALLVDPLTASRLEHERVADVVAHEIAHMWFGDLVTMKWWNGLWLNEAFATFMELLAVDAFRPEWKRWVSFGLSRTTAMVTDGTTATRAIEFPVAAPEEAEGMFDVLTYQKGASVVRMLEQYLGDEAFRAGIRRYIAEHSYGNTETTDLWDALEAATGEPVRSTMDSWIFQGGHPVVSVELSEDHAQVVLRQRRFLYKPGDDSTKWHVPVRYRARVGGAIVQNRTLLTEESIALDFGGKVEWIVVNSGGSGFYRTRYEDDLLARLIAEDGADLDPIERFNLVSDTWASVLAGLAPASEFIELIRRFGSEDDPSVWAAILGPLELFERMLDGPNLAALQAFVRRLVGPAFARVGWLPIAEEEERQGTLRATLLGALGGIGADEAVRTKARELHEAYLADRTALAADLVKPVVDIVARTGGEGEFHALLDQFRHPATPQEEVRALFALAGFRNNALIRRTLDLIEERAVRTQNAPYLLNQVLGNPEFGQFAWDWVKEHWDDLTNRFPDNSHHRMLEGLGLHASADLAADARAFLLAHPIKAGQRSVTQTLERLDVNVAFMEREAPTLATLFE